jgi:hypothetical protein
MKPAKQPRDTKPPKERKEKRRKCSQPVSDSSISNSNVRSQAPNTEHQSFADPTACLFSPDIFQQLPYLQSLLQFAMINPASAQAIVQGNPAIMAMLANPVLMNLLAMSTSYVNSFMSSSGSPNFGFSDASSTFGFHGTAPAMGVASSPFYVPPVDPSVLTNLLLNPDFSPFVSCSASPIAALANPSLGEEPSGSGVKVEHNHSDSGMS